MVRLLKCVDTSVGTLLYTPKKACKIAVATSVLQNICIDSNVPLPDGCNPVDNGQICVQYVRNQLNDEAGVRERLLNGRFSHHVFIMQKLTLCITQNYIFLCVKGIAI